MPAQGFGGELPGHNVLTVPQCGWASISNGALLRLIAKSGKFDIFLTVDKRLSDQNQTGKLPFAIVVLRAKSNRMKHIFPFASEILRRSGGFRVERVYVLTQPD
jgi:hypothetical protein